MIRDPFAAPPVASRRGGPTKEPLSRDAIVTEALRQLSSNGPKGMSLRKVAAALETGPASLYAYVSDLDELHALMLDRALDKVRVRRAANAGWRESLLKMLECYARVLSASPGLAQLAFGIVAVGPNALRITESLLGLLEEGGVDLATAAWAVDLLLLYVTAIVAEHANDFDRSGPNQSVVQAIANASAREYPRVHATRAHLLSGSPEQRFSWALEVFLRGILETPVSVQPTPLVDAPAPPRTRKQPARAR